MSSASKAWYDASEDDGDLYAKAQSWGADTVVLATKKRTQTYLSNKEAQSEFFSDAATRVVFLVVVCDVMNLSLFLLRSPPL
mgnify:CR=1 FL=1